jgi:hypothetical protein
MAGRRVGLSSWEFGQLMLYSTKDERTESTGHGSQTPNGVHRRFRISLLVDGVMPPSCSWIARIG